MVVYIHNSNLTINSNKTLFFIYYVFSIYTLHVSFNNSDSSVFFLKFSINGYIYDGWYLFLSSINIISFISSFISNKKSFVTSQFPFFISSRLNFFSGFINSSSILSKVFWHTIFTYSGLFFLLVVINPLYLIFYF